MDMLRKAITMIGVLNFNLVGYTQTASVTDSPTYSTQDTKIIVEKLIETHGGMKKWNESAAFGFTSVLVFGKPLNTQFWISTEITHIKTERTYHDWHIFGGKLANDGEKTWTENWELGNPPGVNVNSIYYSVALPWLTQRSDVILRKLPKSRLMKDPVFYNVVKMTLKQDSKKPPHKYYKLYIDPKSNLLKGVDYNITYGAFLDLVKAPKGQNSIGPITHVIYSYKNVDGLIFPEKFDTFNEKGRDYGRHIIYNYSLSNKFDESRMIVPTDAVVDTSKRERQ